jgi:hypothetical protein
MSNEVLRIKGEEFKQVDKDKLIEMLSSNSENLKSLSVKLSGKAESLLELVKLIANGDLDYIAPENQQKSVENSIDSQMEGLTSVITNSMCKPKETRQSNIHGSQNGRKKKAL